MGARWQASLLEAGETAREAYECGFGRGRLGVRDCKTVKGEAVYGRDRAMCDICQAGCLGQFVGLASSPTDGRPDPRITV